MSQEDDRRDPSPPLKRRKVYHSLPSKPPPTVNAPAARSPPSAPQLQSQPVLFPIQPLHRFQGASSTIKRPREIAHFSYDDNHEYKEDESGINYYYPPQLGTDLCGGFDTFRHYEDKEDPHLDSLLKAIISKEKKTGEKVSTDFVTWRGMMTKIMTAPFDMFAEMNMLATLYDGTIYIEEDFAAKSADRASQAANNNRRPPNPNQHPHEMMTYWGYKFETLSMIPDIPGKASQDFIKNRRNLQTSNYAQHCSIVRTAFGSNNLILGGEVDGLSQPKSSNPDTPIPWVELKTTEELPPNPQNRDILKYERKLLKFWAQSFLLGVEKVIVGFRSKQGILRAIDTYDTGKIPGMVRRGTACWDGNICINFAAAFLEHLKRNITGEGVYRISLEKRTGVIKLTKVEEQGTGNIVSKEFLEWRQKKDQVDETQPAEEKAESHQNTEVAETIQSAADTHAELPSENDTAEASKPT